MKMREISREERFVHGIHIAERLRETVTLALWQDIGNELWGGDGNKMK